MKGKKCSGDKPYCEGDNFLGEGLFVCAYYDSINEICEYEED